MRALSLAHALLVALLSIPAGPASAGEAPAAPSLGLGKFRPLMTREQGRAAGQINCRPEQRNRDGKPAAVWCDIPADQAQLGNLKVISAQLHYEAPKFDRVAAVVLRVAGRAGPNSSEVARVQGVKLMPQRRSYLASAGGVRLAVSDDLEEPETLITWKPEAKPDAKEATNKAAAQAKSDQALLKGF